MCRGWNIEVGREVGSEVSWIAEGKALRVLLNEEVEWIDRPHVGHQADGDVQLTGFARKDRAGQIVAERVLLPIDEVIGGGNRERISLDGGTRVRRRTEPDDVRPDRDRPVEPVGRTVLERDLHQVPVLI
jgi:hypothetical protein